MEVIGEKGDNELESPHGFKTRLLKGYDVIDKLAIQIRY